MKLLPAGIDIGTTAIRIAVLGIENNRVSVQHMHREARETLSVEGTGAQILRMVQAIALRERRCVAVLHESAASLRVSPFAGVRKREAEAMATLDADRTYGLGAGFARLEANNGTAVIGIGRKAMLQEVRAIIEIAGMKLIAVDHASLACRRVFPHADALIDIGATTTRFMALRGVVPWSTTIDVGGDHLTAAIAAAFGIDNDAAERRKIDRRSAAGGAAQIEVLAEGVGRAIRSAKNAGFAEIERIVVSGNSARLPEFLERVERDTGCIIELAARCAIDNGTFHPDVLAAALPDFAVALGAATWADEQVQAA